MAIIIKKNKSIKLYSFVCKISIFFAANPYFSFGGTTQNIHTKFFSDSNALLPC